ncbi:ShlB/FhaC/HecB family hemolysin secretion/activation protein [uncultured Erythrobacter sp.]|uniref:ShlB/FhaC/HecB family hemolysin secretion/activation protein n=1 Tax=uncultured Erythrobacter sp. TaxID=263913 RepID=UPI002612ADF5|nr:ShlB/FhaC/HecB family hemolysin secretion/activation protein [uncultured Erythrobacter sp.]
MPSPGFEGQTGQIGAVIIRGNEALEEERYQQVVEGFFGEPLTDEVLERLSDELTELAKEAGYPYARASIDTEAAQNGFVEINIDEGRIDRIEITGSDNPAAHRMLEGLVGRPATKADLESTLLLVSDIPALILRGARLQRVDGQGVLLVSLEERGPNISVSADNYGSELFGPVRARAAIRYADVLNSADQVSAAVRINPIEPSELLFGSAAYRTQVTDGGTYVTLAGSLGQTAPGGDLGPSDISGDSRRASLAVSVPLKRSRGASLWLEANAAYISVAQDDLGTLLRDDTLVTASVGLRTRFAVAEGSAGASLWIDRGLDMLGATRLGDPLASRADGDGVFTRYRFSADARLPLVRRLDLYLTATGQMADRPLLASQEIALGGAHRTRGYGFAEVLGDEGIAGLAELRYRFNTSGLPFDFLQLYAFADGGYVTDIGSDLGEGSLFSAGSGVRGRVGIFDFEVEGAFPLGGSGERDTSNDPQINVRAGVNF